MLEGVAAGRRTCEHSLARSLRVVGVLRALCHSVNTRLVPWTSLWAVWWSWWWCEWWYSTAGVHSAMPWWTVTYCLLQYVLLFTNLKHHPRALEPISIFLLSGWGWVRFCCSKNTVALYHSHNLSWALLHVYSDANTYNTVCVKMEAPNYSFKFLFIAIFTNIS
jgi:hypothetical protein